METTNSPVTIGGIRLIKFSEAARSVSLSRTRIYQLIEAGKFPHFVKVGPASMFVESEVQEWIAGHIAKRDAELAAKKAAE